MLKQLGLLQQALVTEQGEAGGSVVGAAGDLDQTAPPVELAVAIGRRGVAETLG
ncbi:hypothetical protein D3C81_2206150 [compost metagenome]